MNGKDMGNLIHIPLTGNFLFSNFKFINVTAQKNNCNRVIFPRAFTIYLNTFFHEIRSITGTFFEFAETLERAFLDEQV